MTDSDLEVKLPSHLAMAWPVLVVMRRARKPLTNTEMEQRVADYLQLSPAQRARPKTPKSTTRTLLGYRLAWSRTLLKKMGAITNPEPATWIVTDTGDRANVEDVQHCIQDMYRILGERTRAREERRRSS